jgi:hypothetical protein
MNENTMNNVMNQCTVGAVPKKARKLKRSKSNPSPKQSKSKPASPKQPTPKKVASPARKARPLLPGNETQGARLKENMESAVLLSTEQIQSEVASESEISSLLQSLPELLQLRGPMETEWIGQFHAVTSLRRVVVSKQSGLTNAPAFVKHVLTLAEDLRSGIIRNCLCCLSELFEFTNFPEEHVVDTVSLLLRKGCCSDKKFIKDLARAVLDSAVKHFDGQALLNALLANATHKNPAVVALCAVLSEQCLGKLAVGKKEGGGVGDLDLKTVLLSLPHFLKSTDAGSKGAAKKSCRRLRRAFGSSTTFEAAVDDALSGLSAAQVRTTHHAPHSRTPLPNTTHTYFSLADQGGGQ